MRRALFSFLLALTPVEQANAQAKTPDTEAVRAALAADYERASTILLGIKVKPEDYDTDYYKGVLDGVEGRWGEAKIYFPLDAQPFDEGQHELFCDRGPHILIERTSDRSITVSDASSKGIVRARVVYTALGGNRFDAAPDVELVMNALFPQNPPDREKLALTMLRNIDTSAVLLRMSPDILAVLGDRQRPRIYVRCFEGASASGAE